MARTKLVAVFTALAVLALAATAQATQVASTKPKLCTEWQHAAAAVHRSGGIYTRDYCMHRLPFKQLRYLALIDTQDEGATSFRAFAQSWTVSVAQCVQRHWRGYCRQSSF